MNTKQLTMHSNPLSQKIIKASDHSFKLWLEFEETGPWDNTENDFANIHVDLLDGRNYAINTWTFKFLASAIQQNEAHGTNLSGLYVETPDLFVKELSRACIEKTIAHLLDKGDLETVLNPSVFGLAYLDPWMDVSQLEDMGEALEKELNKEVHKNHFLHKKAIYLQSKRQDNDDILIELADGRYCVVHLTWSGTTEKGDYPKTEIYSDAKDFWIRKMAKDIKHFNI